MAEVTVSQLAKTVGATVDRLLAQMKEAGLDHSSGEQPVSDDDKQRLLTHLKSSHGVSTEAPKRITLKRRTIGTVKTSGSQGKKTVSVEVRKKRTYVKRSDEDLELEPDADLENEALAAEAAADAAAAALAAAEGEAANTAAQADESDDTAAPTTRRIDPFDVEELRRRAASKRKEQEVTEKARRDAVVKNKAEEAARVKAEAAARVNQAEKEKTAGPKHFKAAPGLRTDDDEPKKKPGKSRKQVKQRGKGRGKGLRLDEFLQDGANSRGIGANRVLQAINKQEFVQPTERIVHEVELGETIAVTDLAQQLAVKANAVIRELMKLGVMTNANQSIDQETAILVVEEFGHKYRIVSDDITEEALMNALAAAIDEDAENVQTRPPVVTVMGHVDHGKTSLLDYIRESTVASGEAGGITQHIGAYQVPTSIGVVTFLDTPGHAAFTSMRARGAECTDIVVLVVAADDGVMPQTIEAIQHARAAEVPLVVAINKIDKESADLERVKNELVAQEVVPEEWGGETQFIPVSAQTGEGIDKLLEALSLQAELLELTAAIDVPAKGIVVESRLDKGRGNVASILVQQGTLRNGDMVLAGTQFGRVRNMSNERRELIDSAGPSIPVEILGLDGTPNAGDEVLVVQDERKAREVAEHRRDKARDVKMARHQKANLDNIFAAFGEAETKTLNVIVKSDVRGSTEAICAALLEIGNEEVQVNIVSSGVGAITDADINLATATTAVVFGFNVRAESSARSMAERDSIEIRYYSIIYNLLDDVKDALSGMLAPEKREEILGTAEVRDVFKSPKFGLVAGCMVVEGQVLRNKPIRVLRDNVVIHEGELDSLRRFKDDVSDVRSGTECGIGIKDYTDVKEGDKIEVFDIHEVERSL